MRQDNIQGGQRNIRPRGQPIVRPALGTGALHHSNPLGLRIDKQDRINADHIAIFSQFGLLIVLGSGGG